MGNGTHGQMGIMVILKIEKRHLGGWDTWVMGHTGNGADRQLGIVVNTEGRDEGPWGMGHMGNGAHGQCGLVLDHV